MRLAKKPRTRSKLASSALLNVTADVAANDDSSRHSRLRINRKRMVYLYSPLGFLTAPTPSLVPRSTLGSLFA